MELKLLTKQAVAKLIGCSIITVDRLRSSEKLPSFKVGRLVRFSEAAVEEYLRRKIIGSEERQTGQTA